MKIKKLVKMVSIGAVAITTSTTALAAPSVEELAQRLKQMQQEMEQIKKQLENSATKQEVQVVKQEVATASEWLQPDTLIHMAGYADVGYTNSESADGSFNVGSFSPIFHFQYRDLVMLESELEFEVGDDGETETTLEYLSIDWFVNDYITLVGGKFLSPIGQFRQNLHPSWINKLPSAPPGFGHDGAAPVSDLGFQLRGGFPIGGVRTNYAVYVSNGPELKAEFEDDEYELDGVEAEGFGADSDGEKVIGGRFGILPFAGFELGLSAASGKTTVTSVEDGDSSVLDGEGTRNYDVISADFSWQIKGFNLRGEYIETEVGADNGAGTAASEGAVWETWYTQGAYRIDQSKWELVARYTDFDSPHDSKDQKQWAIGTNYLFTHSFIGKLSYEFNDGVSASDADQDRVLFQMAYGF
jgi:hypothetical protein